MNELIGDYRPLYGLLLLTLLGIGVLLLDVFTLRRRGAWLGWLTAAGAIVTLALDWTAPDSRPWQGILLFDGYSRAFNAVFLLTLALVAASSSAVESRMKFAGEYYALMAFSTVGLMLMASSGGLIALYLGLELSTICLFALVGLHKRERKSAEASLKMFILGAVTSAVILYGASIVYGVAASVTRGQGGTQFADIAAALAGAQGGLSWALWLGLAFVIGGIGFKIAAVPFHLWAPDVYQGAPTTVTAYLSTASKAAGFAALLRLLSMGLGDAWGHWAPVIAAFAVLSMLLGNIVALAQTNLKRLLAYSGIAQAGYVLVAVAAVSGTAPDSGLAIGAIAMYLLLYAFTNVGGFLIAQAVQDATGSDRVDALRGLHRRNAPLGLAMLVVLFSLGGIPPLAGFVGKLYLFAAGWQGGQQALVLVGALISVVSLYYYLMVALQVYIRDPEDERRLAVARPLAVGIAVCVLGTIAIGVYPRPWVEFGGLAAKALQSTEPFASRAPRIRQSADVNRVSGLYNQH